MSLHKIWLVDKLLGICGSAELREITSLWQKTDEVN
jgi:hypothetical protein